VDAVRSNPEFRNRDIEVSADVSTDGDFDGLKLQRAFFNLLQNACEATGPDARVGVTISGNESSFECLVWDTGHGVSDSIRDTLFEPFVSAGKNNGTGLGLAITAKIVHDHGGQIQIDQTSPSGTTFRVSIPRRSAIVQTETIAVA
jgi:signal transduction histidine kinase